MQRETSPGQKIGDGTPDQRTAVSGLLGKQFVRCQPQRALNAFIERTLRMVAAQIMAAIYRAILGRIEAADYDVFSTVIRIPRPRRALIAASTWARSIARL